MKSGREVVGYISTYGKVNGVSVQIQKEMIDRYCQLNHVICSQIFMDVAYCSDFLEIRVHFLVAGDR